jgi:hypothetical protein
LCSWFNRRKFASIVIVIYLLHLTHLRLIKSFVYTVVVALWNIFYLIQILWILICIKIIRRILMFEFIFDSDMLSNHIFLYLLIFIH